MDKPTIDTPQNGGQEWERMSERERERERGREGARRRAKTHPEPSILNPLVSQVGSLPEAFCTTPMLSKPAYGTAMTHPRIQRVS